MMQKPQILRKLEYFVLKIFYYVKFLAQIVATIYKFNNIVIKYSPKGHEMCVYFPGHTGTVYVHRNSVEET